MKHAKIIIGSRGSRLSLVQTDIVKRQLQSALPDTAINIKIITTTGDKNMSPIPLDSIGKGWFTKEIDRQLLDGDIDMAVHSLKDLPEKLAPGLIIASIPEREDGRETLVSTSGLPLEKLKSGAVIGTDSTRRKSQLLYKRNDIVVKSVRGNVNSRLAKLDNGEYDGLILAAAGLIRLGLKGRITQYFAVSDFVPSPGQGALAVVVKKNNNQLRRIIGQLNHLPTVSAVKAERAFSKAMGGGCKLPVGAYAFVEGNTMTLYGVVGSLDGKFLVKDILVEVIDNPVATGKKLAARLLKTCSPWYEKI